MLYAAAAADCTAPSDCPNYDISFDIKHCQQGTAIFYNQVQDQQD